MLVWFLRCWCFDGFAADFYDCTAAVEKKERATNSEMQSSLQSGYAQAHVCCLGRGHIHLNNSTD